MQRKLVRWVVVAVALLPGAAVAADTPVAEVSQLRMYSSFWQNLHHDRAWPQFRAPVETHVQAYIDGRITLEQMAANLAAAVP